MASAAAGGAPAPRGRPPSDVGDEESEVPAARVLSAPASTGSGAASPATAAAVRRSRTKQRLAEMLGSSAVFPTSTGAAPSGPPGRACGVLSTEPVASQDMAAVPVRKAISGPAPSDPAAARSFRAKGRIARLLEQDAEGPRYVCGLRLELDLMERSSRIGSKNSVGDMSTEGDDEISMSRTWSKGSAGEDNMSRVWSKGSTGEDNMSRTWSKNSAIPFFGRSPTWSVASDPSPRAAPEGLNRFGMPLDMVTESESPTASNDLSESFRGPFGQGALAPGLMNVGQVRASESPTASNDLSESFRGPFGQGALAPGLMNVGQVRASESPTASNDLSESFRGSFGQDAPAPGLMLVGQVRAEALVSPPWTHAVWQDRRPSSTFALSSQPELCVYGCPPPAARPTGCGGLASQQQTRQGFWWADVSPTPPPSQDCGHGPVAPASCGASRPPRGPAAPAPPGVRPPRPPAVLQASARPCGPCCEPPAPLSAARSAPAAASARGSRKACNDQHPPSEQRQRQPQQAAAQSQKREEARQQQQQQKQQQPTLAAVAGVAQRPAGEEGSAGTMRDQLRVLKDQERNCVILARRIQYLGFSASTQLENHFKAFGPVKDVLVPQSHVKNRQAAVRQRPAHLGFVVMASAAGAEAAFEAGTEHVIGGATIILEHFDETRWKAGSDEQHVRS
ncbi:unnamed protein product [Prorocentrum cordatum]|uniref:RRM domain-containing protein n=1 Tax=Prorocentrum cordatum TaxID=2364126 RepID=A0ABN9STV8_9DINO|nr:unnamed protein product [Polarella glacialis]